MGWVRLFLLLCLFPTFAYAAVNSSVVGDALAIPPKPAGLTVVSRSAAQALFHAVATDPDIPFDFYDGCEAKAQKADIFLEQKGVIAGKVFVEGNIYYQSHWGPQFWTIHIAPLVLVQDSGAVHPYVIDPYLSRKLLSYEDWLALIQNDSRTTLAQVYFTNRFVYLPTELGL